VVQFGDAYAIRDGHHRVSVAKALGAASIQAIVAA
jgi:ParB-like chromosome segregation protein Spo0J